MSIDDVYEMSFGLEAELLKVARSWRDRGYHRFSIYADGSRDMPVAVRLEGVLTKLAFIKNDAAMRDYDHLLDVAQCDVSEQAKPAKPSKAARAAALFDRIGRRSGGGKSNRSTGGEPLVGFTQRNRTVVHRGGALGIERESGRQLRYDRDGTLLDENGQRVESRRSR